MSSVFSKNAIKKHDFFFLYPIFCNFKKKIMQKREKVAGGKTFSVEV